ncbi:DUF421 domain-containing protein [Terribacillus sp. DMT04]|uniref:DUF421 domain-containing protein n=1 Tax=Terribacillus sp. DMT04 TaxID=2850441 RepID=UPI001C2CC237|nr:DUF421 domain-containing protein [Terribacillus sp. DMT04]QXE01451.1 DUF421 domain-containing protein [Terribacillus sp. DMT04]
MPGFIHDNIIVLVRIVTIVPLMLFITLYMGKRAIGEMPVFDFLIVVILGAVVGADIADPAIHHLPTAVAIVAIGLFQKAIGKWKISNRTVGRLLTFNPTVVIKDGVFIYENMKKIQYSIDNVLFMLRQKDVFAISDVQLAIVEPNGTISVLKASNEKQRNPVMSYSAIVEGNIEREVLAYLQLDETWLRAQLADRGIIGLNQVFYASISSDLKIHVSLKENNMQSPPLKH